MNDNSKLNRDTSVYVCIVTVLSLLQLCYNYANVYIQVTICAYSVYTAVSYYTHIVTYARM